MPKQLSLPERIIIERMLHQDYSFASIARVPVCLMTVWLQYHLICGFFWELICQFNTWQTGVKRSLYRKNNWKEQIIYLEISGKGVQLVTISRPLSRPPLTVSISTTSRSG